MIEIRSSLIAAILIFLTAPILAERPSDALSKSPESSDYSINRTVINPNDPGFVWGNPNAIDLTGRDSRVFESPSFMMTPGGLMSDMYTSSINSFRRSDPNAGASNATRKTALLGLVNIQYNMPKNSTEESRA